MSHDNQPRPVTFQIGDKSYEGTNGESLLGALRRYGYVVPSLCYHEAVSSYGACRLCLVEVKKGKRTKLTTSCNFPVQEGIQVLLDTERVVKHRTQVFQLLLATAPASPEVKALAAEYGVNSTPYQSEDPSNRCILCGLCNRVCTEVVGASAIDFAGRGQSKRMESPYNETAEACIGCGACAYVCPTHCIGFREEAGMRILDKWHRKLPLATCKKCGTQIAPTFQLMHFAKQIGVDKNHFDHCPECR